MKTTKEMKAAIEKMMRLYEESDNLFDTNEEASDRAYNEAHTICEELINTIVKISRGMIDRKIARTMVLGNPEKLIALCEKF